MAHVLQNQVWFGRNSAELMAPTREHLLSWHSILKQFTDGLYQEPLEASYGMKLAFKKSSIVTPPVITQVF